MDHTSQTATGTKSSNKIPIATLAPGATFSEKSLQGQYCLSPFVSVEIGLKGDVHLCNCSRWMPLSVGNILDTPLTEILANAASQAVRASIRDGTYRYCDESRCGVMANNLLNTRDTLPPDVSAIIDNPAAWILPREIVLSGDIVCNLSCPSCRTKLIRKNRHPFMRATEVAQTLLNNMFSVPTTQDMRLMVSTTGEIFASTVLMKMVAGISGLDFPNLKLKLQTNGILAPKRWSKLGDMADRVESVTVTVDAAQAPTYEQLRRGAKWHQIQSAMSWLQERKSSHGVRLHTRMIVQRENFLEIEQFYHWSMAYGVDIVEYARIMDWQTFGDSFLYHDVFDPKHDLFLTAQKELAKVAKLSNVLLFGGLHTSG